MGALRESTAKSSVAKWLYSERGNCFSAKEDTFLFVVRAAQSVFCCQSRLKYIYKFFFHVVIT